MAKKKVLFVITKSNWGGAQRYVYDLATNLSKDQFEVVVVLGGTGAKDADAGQLAERLIQKGISVVFVKSFMRDIAVLKEWRAMLELVRIFKAEQPDVVHLNSSKAGALGALAARMAGVKTIIFTSHGLVWEEDRNPLAKSVIYAVTRATFHLCHKIITITKKNYDTARKNVRQKEKVVLIHNGIAEESFLSKEEARAKLGLDKDAFIIGGIGELTWNKGWHTLLRAGGILKRQNCDFKIAIIGGGEEAGFLKGLADEEVIADHTSLLGFVENAAQYAKAFDIFVLASVKEGLPYVLLEAGQAGVPVVASRVGGVPDIVEDGVTGVLFTSKKPGELADAILELRNKQDTRAMYAEALQRKVSLEFNLYKMVSDTTALY